MEKDDALGLSRLVPLQPRPCKKKETARSDFFSSLLFFGKAGLSPSAEGSFSVDSFSSYLQFSSAPDRRDSRFYIIMPITNKEAAPGAAMKAEIEDYTKALEVVKTYTTQDGLDVDTLLDSDKHGALTYNDFLVLPGYIGKLIWV